MKPRILFPYDAHRPGGHVVSSFHLIEGLHARGYDAVVAVHGHGPVRDMAIERDFPLIEMPPLGAMSESHRGDGFRWGNISAAPGALSILQKQRFDVVHINDKRMLRTWGCPAALAGKRIIAHWRSTYSASASITLMLRLAERILCVSRYSLATLPDFAQRKAETILNPFPDQLTREQTAKARKDIRGKLAIPENVALIGVFGSFLKRKRPHVLLDLLRDIERTDDGRAIWGLACGERATPHDVEFEETLHRHPDLKERLITPGRVTPVLHYMAACDVIIAPATAEPFARVGIEAQAAGVPVLVSSDGGLPEIVEDGVSGLVLHPMNAEAWRTSVRRVLNSSAFTQRLIDGGRISAARLTLDRHVDAVSRFYDQSAAHVAPDRLNRVS